MLGCAIQMNDLQLGVNLLREALLLTVAEPAASRAGAPGSKAVVNTLGDLIIAFTLDALFEGLLRLEAFLRAES